MTNEASQALHAMGDDSEAATIPSTKRGKKLDPGFKTNIKLIGAAGALAIFVVTFMMFKFSQPATNERRNETQIQVGTGQREKAEGMTPAMAEMLTQKQHMEAQAAAAKGASYIPPDAMPTVPVGPTPITNGAAGSNALSQESYIPTLSQSDQVMFSRQREGLERQLKGLLDPSVTESTSVRQRISVDRQAAELSTDASPRSAGGQAGATASTVSSQKGGVVVNGHYIAPALLANKLEVPEGRKVFASAKIEAGPYAGAFLTGNAGVVNEGLALHFDKMSFRGKFYSVDVTGLDENTSADAIAGKVDNRILERWIMPVTMATVGGYFQSKAQTGQTIVNVGTVGPTGMAGVATPPPTSEQAKAAGIAAGLQIGQREVAKAANAPIIVSKEAKFPMGLIFNAPVYEADAK